MILNDLLAALPQLYAQHSPSSIIYKLLRKVARNQIEELFKEEEKHFGPFGTIKFPYFKMGAVDSLNLFDLDELILFSYYFVNKDRYKKAVDIGANIGLHSLILSKLGYEVQSFEPDPVHFKQLSTVFDLNNIETKGLHCAAVSSKSGQAEFTRVLGNTTSSHLSGSKTPYGELERFLVPLFDINSLKADLIKMDVEGHEAEILLATTKNYWANTDCFVEVGSPDKADLIFHHFNRLGIYMFAQKTGWKQVKESTDIPVTYKEGALFITSKPFMNWD